MSKKLAKKPTNKITKIKKNSNDKTLVSRHESKHYSGPIPQPSDLQQYEDIKIGFAERIITMAENEASHRHDIEHKIINSERFFGITGQILGFLIGFLVIALMGYAIKQGFADQVQWIGIGIASVIGLFIYKRK